VNTIVVESKDRAGNVAQKRLSVSYAPNPGTNWGAIGLMICLLVVGLVVGIFYMMRMGPKPEPVTPEPEAPLDTQEKGAPAEWVAPAESEELPPAEAVEPVPMEEPGMSEELPPIPPEESMPEELPPVAEEPVVPETPVEEPAANELGRQSSPNADAAQTASAADVDPLTAEKLAKLDAALANGKISQDIYDKNKARVLQQASAPAPSADSAMTDKITKLDKALADGKITKELYDKNVARIKGQ
jgi:hypothetical protein